MSARKSSDLKPNNKAFDVTLTIVLISHSHCYYRSYDGVNHESRELLFLASPAVFPFSDKMAINAIYPRSAPEPSIVFMQTIFKDDRLTD